MTTKRRGHAMLVALAMGLGACGDDRSMLDDDSAGALDATQGDDRGQEDDDNGADDSEARLDVQPGGGGGAGDCTDPRPGSGVPAELSYIWIANSDEGTVSKIDTRSGDELGRYYVDADPDPQPSRTSVNLLGDVAVANRGSWDGGPGSVTKIAAEEDRCIDKNGDGAIQTSSGASDVLPWGEDECVLWNTPVPTTSAYFGPRALAWEAGLDADGCAAMNPRLWMGWWDDENTEAVIWRMNGETGAPDDEVRLLTTYPSHGDNRVGWPDNLSPVRAPYGGAVDQDGNFWVVGVQNGPIARISGETLEPKVWNLGIAFADVDIAPHATTVTYGIAIDPTGRPWDSHGGAVLRFDPTAEERLFLGTQLIGEPTKFHRGVMIDADGTAWFATDTSYGGERIENGGCGLTKVDTRGATFVEKLIPIPGCIQPVGVSIDTDGYVWLVDRSANKAFKVDPATHEVILEAEGLVGPYTYSDMTGVALRTVSHPPAG